VRLAAAGDLHCAGPEQSSHVLASLAAVAADADLILLAGDITESGRPEQAAALADACGRLETPVVAVLGNHEWHARRQDEIVAVLRGGGIVVLDGAHHIVEARATAIGVVGTTGFKGGFGSRRPSSASGRRGMPPAWAEHLVALDAGLQAVAACAMRIVLLHYSPTTETLVGERRELWDVLGAELLASPIAAHRPNLVVHAHAHKGSSRGEIGDIPVYNVSMPVIGNRFKVLELGA
jgi:Icc-related predicted phosphoesterase